jgi:multiple sugar transport system permease protein
MEPLAGYVLTAPAVVYILLLVGYPFFLSLFFSFNRVFIGGDYEGFVGLSNFTSLFANEVFQRAFWNTLGFTFFSEIGKGVLGVGLAFLLLQPLRGKKVVRAFLVLPFTLPFALSLLGWQWMFDPEFSVINYLFGHQLHWLPSPYPDWLGDPFWSYLAILIVNIWRGFPFAGVIILAGLTSVPSDFLDAAKVDGAGFFRTWHYVITPIIAPILFIGLIYDATFTLGDLTAVYRLTQGGPGFATETLPMEAWQTGIVGGNLGAGSAITLFLFPFLVVAVVFFLRMLYRREAL